MILGPGLYGWLCTRPGVLPDYQMPRNLQIGSCACS